MTKKILWGLFFIAAAALIITNQLGLLTSITLPSLILTIIILPILFQSIAHTNFFGIMFSLAFLAIVFSKPLGITEITPWPVLFSALFSSIGLSIIFKKKNHNFFKHNKKDCEKFQETIDYLDDGVVECSVKLGESSKYLNSPNLQKAILKCSLGSMKVYFDNTQLSENGADVFVDCSLGSIELFIPKTWQVGQVNDNISVSLGSVNQHNKPNFEGGAVLNLKGNVSLGSVEVYYI